MCSEEYLAREYLSEEFLSEIFPPTWAECLWDKHETSKQIEGVVRRDIESLGDRDWFLRDVSDTDVLRKLARSPPNAFIVTPRIAGVTLWWNDVRGVWRRVQFDRTMSGYKSEDSDAVWETVLEIAEDYRKTVGRRDMGVG